MILKRFFLLDMITLKQFLDKNKIETTSKQRAIIGRALVGIVSPPNVPKVKEDNYYACVYDENSLNQTKVQMKIIEILTK